MEHHQHHQYRYSYPHDYNLYSILQLPCYTSNEEEIGKAFLKQSQLYHPANNDQNSDPNSRAWYEAIEHAYEILKDSKTRTEYDQFLASSTQYDFNRLYQPAKPHSYLSWITSWDRKPETTTRSTCRNSTSSKSTADEGDSSSLMDHIQALESELSALKATNSKIWAQASFHIAKTDCLLREKTNLQEQLEANQQAFYRRERGYVSRIRSLESTVASLRRILEDHTKTDANKETDFEPKNHAPRLIVTLNSQPIGKPISNNNAANTDSKTPTFSNLTSMSTIKDPKLPALVLEASQHSKQEWPYSMPSLVDKENLDDACKINVKRILPELKNQLPDAKKQKRRPALGEAVAGSN